MVTVGKLGEKHWIAAAEEYTKRLSAFCKFDCVEVPEYRLPANPSPAEVEHAMNVEGKAIIAKLPARAKIVALCIEGETMSSEVFAGLVADAAGTFSRLAVIIGGSHGLSEEAKAAASLRLSFSPMTFPHQLARVMALEQIYRAFSIGAGTKYHK
jgi:23S rRNA (pseudouridine1915-N3)-methyltransferase